MATNEVGVGVDVKVGDAGTKVAVDEAVLVGVCVPVGVTVSVAVGFAVDVGLGVSEGVQVEVDVGVLVGGRKGVLVVVGVSVIVGVKDAVLVKISGAWLPVAVKMLKVSVTVDVIGVVEGVSVIALGSGANCTASQPRQ